MKQTLIRYITGLVIIGIGIGALLDALTLINFWEGFSDWWPVLLILAGISTIIGDFRRNYIWGIALTLVGSLLLLNTFEILSFNVFALILPVVIIAAGLSVLIGSKSRSKVTPSSHNSDDISVIFSGSETMNKSKNYQGGKITSIFGGASLDLRDAKIEKEAVLDLFVLFGGVELKVPREWKVVSKVAPIAGGVENKAQGSDDHKGPVLVLTGSATFGGVEIKT